MNYKNNIEAMPQSDRPYEKLETYGQEALTDSELLAIIIRCGTKKMNATQVAQNLLNSFSGSLPKIFDAGINELRKIEGIGLIKAIQIKALGELSKRYDKQRSVAKITAREPSEVGRLLAKEMGDRSTECFRVILLNKKLAIIGMKDISIGTLDRTLVHPREVFSYAIRELASAIIIAHNHPSGDCTPSKEDIFLTKQLCEAGDIVGISVLDHFIVGGANFFSMRMADIMPEKQNAA